MDNFIIQRSHWSKKVNTSLILLVSVVQMVVSNKILSSYYTIVSKKILHYWSMQQIASVCQNDAPPTGRFSTMSHWTTFPKYFLQLTTMCLVLTSRCGQMCLSLSCQNLLKANISFPLSLCLVPKSSHGMSKSQGRRTLDSRITTFLTQ